MIKIKSEVEKSGITTLFNLKLNFFASYSAVIQAIMARIDLIAEKIINKLQGKSEVKAIKV